MGPRINEELLRKRAEHNEGCLSNLEEITLHQQQLEVIENLDVYCRHLKILYLQNNIIQKMSGLRKLKELEYLNMALNNVQKIEGLENCESLKKLDLTVNFIDLDNLEESMVNLSRCPLMKDLYMTGNPCTDWKGYRDFVIATVESLETLDGTDVNKSERIKAKQIYDELLIDLYHSAEMRKIEKEIKEEKYRQEDIEREESYKGLPEEEVEALRREEKKPYTIEMRTEMYREMAEQAEKKEKERNPEKFVEKKESPMFRPDGEIRQCNEGKYKFKLREWDDPETTFFDMQIPKFLDTSLVDVNVNPKWVSVRVKGKLTQLKMQEEIKVEESKIQRSQITGELVITMPKVKIDEVVQMHVEKATKLQKEEDDKKKKEEQLRIQKRENTFQLCEKYEKKVVEIKNQDYTTFDDVPDLE